VLKKIYPYILIIVAIVFAVLYCQGRSELRDQQRLFNQITANNTRVIDDLQSTIDKFRDLTGKIDSISSGLKQVNRGVEQVNNGIGDVKGILRNDQSTIERGKKLVEEQSAILEGVRGKGSKGNPSP
jgi:methyl-accepting chemotaxis protein